MSFTDGPLINTILNSAVGGRQETEAIPTSAFRSAGIAKGSLNKALIVVERITGSPEIDIQFGIYDEDQRVVVWGLQASRDLTAANPRRALLTDCPSNAFLRVVWSGGSSSSARVLVSG